MTENEGEFKKRFIQGIKGLGKDPTVTDPMKVLDQILEDARKEFPDAKENENWITLAMKRGAWFKKWIAENNP